MKMIRNLSRAGAAALLIAALAVPASAASAADIGIEKAKEIALNHAGITENDTLFLTAEPDYDDGRLEYEVEFYDGQKEYDYTIDAKTGTILKFDTDLEWYSPSDDAGYGWKNVIGKQRAKEIALSHAGILEGDAQRLVVKPDWDDGFRVYDVEFFSGGKEYDYEIDAETGNILSMDGEAGWSAGTPDSKPAAGDIGSAKAKSIALNHAGVKEENTDFLRANKDWDDGRWVYDVEFWAGGKEYDYEILASNGTIVSYDYDAEYNWQAPANPGSGSSITAEKAKSIALDHAGLKSSQVDYIRAQQDWDDGRSVYDVEFWAGGKEYDYEILASNGTIVSYDYDAEYNWQAPANPGSGSSITAEKAKSIALDHAGLKSSQADYIRAQQDWDDGRSVYDVEFWAGGKEYDYEILASDGTIVSYDYDAEYNWSGSAGNGSSQGSYISEAKAKSIVTDRAGVSGTFVELKLDYDDGRAVYEGEMRSGRTEYEFEIDAVTGTILEWDADWDD